MCTVSRSTDCVCVCVCDSDVVVDVRNIDVLQKTADELSEKSNSKV